MQALGYTDQRPRMLEMLETQLWQQGWRRDPAEARVTVAATLASLARFGDVQASLDVWRRMVRRDVLLAEDAKSCSANSKRFCLRVGYSIAPAYLLVPITDCHHVPSSAQHHLTADYMCLALTLLIKSSRCV